MRIGESSAKQRVKLTAHFYRLWSHPCHQLPLHTLRTNKGSGGPLIEAPSRKKSPSLSWSLTLIVYLTDRRQAIIKFTLAVSNPILIIMFPKKKSLFNTVIRLVHVKPVAEARGGQQGLGHPQHRDFQATMQCTLTCFTVPYQLGPSQHRDFRNSCLRHCVKLNCTQTFSPFPLFFTKTHSMQS